MVQDQDKTVSESEDLREQAEFEIENTAKGVESGKYKLIGWAIDTTGRRLIDEICQIAAYTPDSEFSQYIMPFGDIPFLYGQIHNIRISNMGRYRILKDTTTNKVIKTKSDITALTEFVDWLEKIHGKGDCADGIILIFHEFHKWTPPMLIEILKKHLLLDRFSKVVKGFANSFALCSHKCATTTKSFKLHVMTSVLLGQDNVDLSSAVQRASACYDLVAHLGIGEREELDIVDTKASGDNASSSAAPANTVCATAATGGSTDALLVDMIRPYTNPVEAEEDEIKVFKVLLERQNTFKPVFSAHLRASTKERQRASHLRRLLAMNNIDLNTMKEAWEKNGREELESIIKGGVADVAQADLDELLEIFDAFLDPEKKPILPKKRFFDNNNRRFRTGKYRPRPRNMSESERTTSTSVAEESTSNGDSVKEGDAKVEIKKENLAEATEVKIESEDSVVESTAAAVVPATA